MQRDEGKPDWDLTKRQLGWRDVGLPPNSDIRQKTAAGEGGGRFGGSPPYDHPGWTHPRGEKERENERTCPDEGDIVTSSRTGKSSRTGPSGDLKNFDLAATVEKLLGVMYATDYWAEPDWGENGMPCDNIGLNEKDKTAGKWREAKAPKSTLPRLQPFLKHYLYSEQGGGAEEEKSRRALSVLSEEGKSRQSAAPSSLLAELGGPDPAEYELDQKCYGNWPTLASWGGTCPTDEYTSTELRVGNLTFDCIDFGENSKLSTALKQKTQVGVEVDTQKRTIQALAAGVARVSQV